MAVLRALLIAVMLAVLIVAPALAPLDDAATDAGTVSAAPFGGPLLDNHNGNNNGNTNGNANNNGNTNNNGNNNGNENRNDNDDDDDNGDDNDNDEWWPPPPPPPPPPPSEVSRCFAAGETGAQSLDLPGGSVTLTVVSASSFPGTSRVTLRQVSPASIASPPGALLDDIVFEVRAQNGCDGGTLGELLADANLGLAYHVSADRARLRFAVWDGSRWLDVPTVPDPVNPYVSATIRRTGIYIVYQAP